MKFKGQVSLVWALVIGLMNIATIGICIYYGFSGITYVLIPVLILMDIIVSPALFINYVEVEKKIVTIHYGFTTVKVLIDDITSVKRSDALFGTYAVGTDKIMLKKKNQDELVISLQDNKGFINELKRQNKKMKIFI